jgi:hypothetical protein
MIIPNPWNSKGKQQLDAVTVFNKDLEEMGWDEKTVRPTAEVNP